MNRKTRRGKLKQPCHCGSGIRYDKCHYRKEKALQGAIKIFQEKEQTREIFIEKHGQIRKPQLLKMGDKHLVVVGNKIFLQKNPGPYNFVNAIHDYALHVFGDDFLENEEKKRFQERHPAIQWLHASGDHHNKMLARKNAKPEDFQFGLGAAWTRLAYDLFTIKDNAELQDTLRERLLFGDFQAARHELWVAALFVAAGFDIKFVDETKNTSQHPEFIATDKKSGIKIAVEAKSRQRLGVKGFKSGKPYKPEDKLNMRNIVVSAYKDLSAYDEIPLYVFIDVNLPPADTDQQQKWHKELDDTMNDIANEGYCDPCPAHGVFFHNDPSHYIEGLITNDTDHLWIKYYVDKNPSVNKQYPQNIIERIMTAHHQRAIPPETIPNF